MSALLTGMRLLLNSLTAHVDGGFHAVGA